MCPEHAVAGRLAGGAGADHVADEGDLEAVLAELGDGVEAALEAGLAHGEGVQRDVGAAPGVAGRGEVVGVDLAVDLEDLDLDGVGERRAGGEPLGLGPGLQHLGGGGVLRLRQRGDFVEAVIDQGDVGERLGGLVGQLLVLEGGDQRGDVVAAEHGAEDLRRRPSG